MRGLIWVRRAGAFRCVWDLMLSVASSQQTPGELVLEGGVDVSTQYRIFGGWGLHITCVEFAGKGGVVFFPWYIPAEIRCFLSPFLIDTFPYVLEGKGFFFFLLFRGGY